MKRIHAVLAGTCLLLATTLALAAPLAPVGTDNPCLGEDKRLCPGVAAGPPLYKCMKLHDAEVTPACKERKEAVKKRISDAMTAFQAVCQSDLERFCKKSKPAHGRILRCMKRKSNQLAPECRTALNGVIYWGGEKGERIGPAQKSASR